VAVHEFGHLLGLEHPGQTLNPPAALGTAADYLADAPALMGAGMEMRPVYYEQWRSFLEGMRPGCGPFTIR
jgi:hypothetical protein